MRGLSIVLVVMFHVQLVDMATGANQSLCTTLPTIFTPIRMPFFIFTSGGLLYLSRIRREWTTRALYADKLRRIAIPFVFFVTFYYLFKLLAGACAKTPVPLSLSYFAECFYRFTGHLSAHPRGAVGTATALPPRAPVLGHQGVSGVQSATCTVPPTTYIMEMRQNSPYELFWRISCLPA